MDIKIYSKAEDIPKVWDEVAENSPFFKRKYLKLLEDTNPCNSKYYLVHDGKYYCFVTYKLKLDMFTYNKNFHQEESVDEGKKGASDTKSPIKVIKQIKCINDLNKGINYISSKLKVQIPITIIGIPASVSASGYFCYDEEVFIKVLEKIKGIKVILNSSDKFTTVKRGFTLPDCIMYVNWNTFEDYLNSMKNNHRYRYNKIKNQGKHLKVREFGEGEEFTEELYKLYENVYFKSKFKLEKLPIDFFRYNGAKTTVFTLENKAVGFVQTFREKETFYFLFGGINYKINESNSLYFNMLYHIMDLAIKSGAKWIKMGQTAEDAKLRLGCVLEEKYMYIHSSNKILNTLAQYLVPMLSYKYNFHEYHVFRDINTDNKSF